MMRMNEVYMVLFTNTGSVLQLSEVMMCIT